MAAVFYCSLELLGDRSWPGTVFKDYLTNILQIYLYYLPVQVIVVRKYSTWNVGKSLSRGRTPPKGSFYL